MASSSLHGRGLAPPRSDVFRPSLPLDPFAELDRSIPWHIAESALQQLAERENTCQVVLIIGEPSIRDIEPLWQSLSLARSLLLIVTSNPPTFAPKTSSGPSVYVLRTLHPLPSDNAQAVHLVSILERAEHVSRKWRAKPREGELKQWTEKEPGGEFSIEEDVAAALLSPKRRYSALRRPRSAASFSSSKSKSTKRTETSESSRAFDAVLHFVPETMPEKIALKQAILLTTLSSPFLATIIPHHESVSSGRTSRPGSLYGGRSRPSSISSSKSLLPIPHEEPDAPLTPPPPRRPWSRNSRLSIRSLGTPDNRSRDSLAANQQRPYIPRNAHIVHVLPQAMSNSRSKLVQSIEQFLLSFSYSPPPRTRSTPASLSGTNHLPKTNVRTDKPLPFLVPVGVLGHTPRTPFSVGELVLLGALDPDMGAAARPRMSGMSLLQNLSQSGSPRVWIGSGEDVLVGDDVPTPPSVVEESVVMDDGPEPSSSSSSTPRKRRKKRKSLLRTGGSHLPTPPASSSSSDSHSSSTSERSSLESEMTTRQRADSAPSAPQANGVPTLRRSRSFHQGEQQERDATTTATAVHHQKWKFWRRLFHRTR